MKGGGVTPCENVGGGEGVTPYLTQVRMLGGGGRGGNTLPHSRVRMLGEERG